VASLTSILSDLVSDAFAAAGLPRELGQVRSSDRPDLAQFQCNGAMPAAKVARTAPRKIAEDIAARLKDDPRLARLEIAGPGFLNIDLSDAFLAEHTNEIGACERLGCPEVATPRSVVLDYGGPNVAKPMHVGHLRASVIGDSLRRLFAFAGDATVGDVHMGDWGLPMGQLITELQHRHPDWPYFDAGHKGPFPSQSPVSLDDLERLYPAAVARCKEDPEVLEEARQATVELQAGRPGYRALWQHFMEVTIDAMKRDFDSLGVEFDLWFGEAVVNDLIPPMVADLKARGIAEDSEGAVVVPVAEEGDKADIPPLILLKSDGAVMYGTTDLATIEHRRINIDPDLVLYVVDQRQHLHFQQVFRAAAKAGTAGRAALEHIGFGTVNGPDGKPFKTREGGVMRLQDLVEGAARTALTRLDEAGLATDYDAAERGEIARKVGLAAIRFADLSNYRLSNYIFDLDRFTRFEGKTGPYLLYAAVRIKSLLRKAADQGFAPGAILPPGEVERDLTLALGRLPDAIDAAYDRRAPNELCEFAHELAQVFSRFYQRCHILSESDAALQASRLGLAEVTLKELLLVLSLLGIEVPERM
jgi:arginyl-tRNA synthetase